MSLKPIIKKLERQHRELRELIVALRRIDRAGWIDTKINASFEEFEKHLIAEAVEHAHGNKTEAARILQISRDKLRYKMAKHGLK
jgi:DNA-binding NtrC family response regulator